MKHRPIDNPPNPYHSVHAEWLEPPPEARIEVFEDNSRSILSRNESPDLPFRWSINPYRGCQHACTYCYARPSHEYLDWGAGTDFETKLTVKLDAPVLLRKSLNKPSWKGEPILFSGNTDCYQPLEASHELTRRCLEVCLEFRNPIVIVTKAFLVVRDVELIAELNRKAGAVVYLSIPFADGETAKAFEPQAPPPGRRFEAVRRLSEADIPVGVFVAPIIPGVTDRDIPEILRRAADAGARSATYTPLRLPTSVQSVFIDRLQEAMPLRAKKVIGMIRAMRGGSLDDARFGHRMRGSGPYWESIRRLFSVCRQRCGLDESLAPFATGSGRSSSRGGCRGRSDAPSAQMSFDFVA